MCAAAARRVLAPHSALLRAVASHAPLLLPLSYIPPSHRAFIQAEFQDICKEYGVEQFVGALDECAAAHSADQVVHVHATSASSR